MPGELSARPQEEAKATYTELLTKESGAIDWSLPATEIERRVRAFIPWPVAFATWKGGTLRVFAAQTVPGSDAPTETPGTVLDASGDAIEVQTGEGRLSLVEVQPAGGRRMSAGDFARGRPEIRDARFSGPS